MPTTRQDLNRQDQPPSNRRTFHTADPAELDALLDLSDFLDSHSADAVLVGKDGQQIPIPESIFPAIVEVVEELMAGRAVTIAPTDTTLTTQQAADFIGVSRPTLVKLINQGRLRATYPSGSRHRRINLSDIVAYQKEMQRQTERHLRELVSDAEESGLYDISPDVLTSAVRNARKPRQVN